MRVEANSSLVPHQFQPVRAASDAQIGISDSLQSGGGNPEESMGIISSVKEKFLNACTWVKNLLCSIFNFISCGCFSKVSPLDELKQAKSDFEDLLIFFNENKDSIDFKQIWMDKFDALSLKRQDAIMREDFRGMALEEFGESKDKQQQVEKSIEEKMGALEKREKCLAFIRSLEVPNLGENNNHKVDPMDFVPNYIFMIIEDLDQQIEQQQSQEPQ